LNLPVRDERGPIALAEKVLALLEEGRFTATYKYAVLLALIDLCLENTSKTGTAPQTLTTRQLAEKIVEIYWPHCVPYGTGEDPVVLRQSLGGRTSQAAIVRAITRFRSVHASDPNSPRARSDAPAGFESLVRDVEWKLIEMPLPRLQRFGHGLDEFLYSIAWDTGIREAEVRAYQRGRRSVFDNRINLRHRTGEDLVLLNGLLRPLIHRQWAGMVAKLNRLEEARLEEFLFGAHRISLDPIRSGLREIQNGRCFYCEERIATGSGLRPQVDHFIPWTRYPNNAIENLVVAHESCNQRKRDFLAAAEHVGRWRDRLDENRPVAGELLVLAASTSWERNAARSLGVARAIYLRLPTDIPLWLQGSEFVPLHPERIATILDA
jgi:5-methylcytosine-specific restriction endonuclease McrA